MKLQLNHLKSMKNLESQRQQDFIFNCKKIMALMKERQKDYILEQIIHMDESVRAITTDISAFKNIRTQLFQMENDGKTQDPEIKKLTGNKYFIFLFKLFESVI